MANKHDVLRLLAKGLNPQEVAAELDCSDAYVRATRQRALDPDYARRFEAYKRSRAVQKVRYATDPDWRKKHNKATWDCRKKRMSQDPAFREKFLAGRRDWYHANK